MVLNAEQESYMFRMTRHNMVPPVMF